MEEKPPFLEMYEKVGSHFLYQAVIKNPIHCIFDSLNP
jgi:hypothetical protein